MRAAGAPRFIQGQGLFCERQAKRIFSRAARIRQVVSQPPCLRAVQEAPPICARGGASTHTMLASSSFSGRALAFKAQQQRSQRPHALEVVAKESRIGKQPVPLPPKVTVTLDGNLVMVKVRGGGLGAVPRVPTPVHSQCKGAGCEWGVVPPPARR